MKPCCNCASFLCALLKVLGIFSSSDLESLVFAREEFFSFY
jgi:hypothetical protein